MTASESRPLPARIARPDRLGVLLGQKKAIDLTALFGGELNRVATADCIVLSPLSGKRVSVSAETLQKLANWLPSDVKAPEDVQRELGIATATLRDWLRDGLLIAADSDPGAYARQARRNKALQSSGWESEALISFAASRWSRKKGPREQSIAVEDRERHSRRAIARHVARHGPMPGPYHERAATRFVELPYDRDESPLSRVLAARQTTRLFDESRTLPLPQLAETLHYAFGARGESDLGDDECVLKKYNPSGGALHSIEAYPLLLNVDGAEPGLYHYNVRHHRLDLLKEMPKKQARDRVVDLLAGQHWYQSAHAIIFMTSRFERAFWKYRNHAKAYKSIVMDAGHISQTIYLLAAERGLGAFVTMAMNDVELEQLLDIDFVEEGLIAACGIGVRKKDGNSFSMAFRERGPSD